MRLPRRRCRHWQVSATFVLSDATMASAYPLAHDHGTIGMRPRYSFTPQVLGLG